MLSGTPTEAQSATFCMYTATDSDVANPDSMSLPACRRLSSRLLFPLLSFPWSISHMGGILHISSCVYYAPHILNPGSEGRAGARLAEALFQDAKTAFLCNVALENAMRILVLSLVAWLRRRHGRAGGRRALRQR